MDNSLTMHDPEFKLSICVETIFAEGMLPQNCYIGPGSFSATFGKHVKRKITKSYPLFVIK